MSQDELDQLLANQTETSTKIVSPVDNETIDDKIETIEKDIQSPNDNNPPANYNPYSYPPPSLGMPFGTFPPHLMPHMAQMMQNSKLNKNKYANLILFIYLDFPGFGSIPPPAHLLRFMMPPFINPPALAAGKTLETLQTELRKVSVFFFDNFRL
jgi:hypothetical protein